MALAQLVKWILPHDEDADDLEHFGVPPLLARMLARTVRRDVTDTVCSLLPGVERTTGAIWLFAFENLLAVQVKEMVRDLEPGIPEPQLNSAAFAVGVMFPISQELRRRHDAALPETPLLSCPPTRSLPDVPEQLRRLREIHATASEEILSAYGTSASRMLQRQSRVDAVTKMVASMDDFPWGSWTAFAAVAAVQHHGDILPVPGRTASEKKGAERDQAEAAGLAFTLARAITIDTAVGLIARAGVEY
ncbi:hypothetical protein Aca07nite_88070 [Actinoplanes capillaceus]|uniref:Uncharacterized protein n=1 Tax=Actinoplanes campanulatus TaxID=113559 RepID=A0ABQ3WZ02_9ACTN|nr:hypothetical protein [Actinoplanes capillaceus]GID51532.1 hypothetical protein Aca07nite_88070 [Actinoplanes capillaceus]